MNSSWIFLARVSPSYEGYEPSRAELGHFNFRAENELDFFFDIQLFLLQFSFFTPKIRHFKKKQYNFYSILLQIILFLPKMTDFWSEKKKLC